MNGIPEVDPVTAAFAALDEYFPGSRQKRRPATPLRTPKRAMDDLNSIRDWDAKPVTKRLNGREVEMFTIGALAKALGKAEGTIRAYQDKGYLPKTPYRLPTRMVNGAPRAGRRLFTRGMVEAAIKAFADRDLIDAKRVEWRDHPDLPAEITAAWKAEQASLSKS